MTNYTFYVDKYLSEKEAVLDAASFSFWERKACNVVRNLTFGNIDETAEVPENVQMCVCEVAELLKTQEQQAKTTGLASEKVGDYSVSYRVQTDKEKKTETYNVVSEWLENTGLMYCGVT